MTIYDNAIAILQKTGDGNLLTPADLHLVEAAVNHRLTEEGGAKFNALCGTVLSGSYAREPHWFHGIEHLTRDHTGYVSWKARQVEHFSFSDKEREKAAAEELAGICQKLESIGFPVNSRTVLSPACYEATANTCWKVPLQTYYAFFEGAGQFAGIFYRKGEAAMVSPVFSVLVSDTTAAVLVTEHAGAYEAFHTMQNAGMTCLSCEPSFKELVGRLSRLGVCPERLTAEIQGNRTQ